MAPVPGDVLDPAVEQDYLDVVRKHAPEAASPERLERQAFYTRASKAYAIVMTGELRTYANLLLKKGVTPR